MATNDGSANAPAGSAQLPSLLSSYAHRPTWLVAGVDYYVGCPQGLTLLDPSTISIAGVSVDKANHMVTITGNNVTLSGYDFSLAGGWGVTIQGQNATIANSKFVVGSNGNSPILGGYSSGNVTVTACTIDGANNANLAGPGLIEMRGSGTLTVNYCWLTNSPFDMIDMHNNGPASLVLQYNLIQNAGMAPGAHGDITEFIGGPYTATIDYNTTTQNGGTTQGFMVEPDLGSSPGSITGGSISHNTMMGSNAEFTGITVADLKGTFSVDNNYFDPSKSLLGLDIGGVRGGTDDASAYSVYVNNVNMINGSIEQDSNAPNPPPPPPTATVPTISTWSPDSGVAGDGVTNATVLTLKGTAAANGVVTVYDNGSQIGTATANSSGSWTYTTTARSSGANKFTATDTVSGVTSAASSGITVTIDTVAPGAPVETGASVNGNQVNVSGTAEGGSTVQVFDGTTLVGTATATSAGSWSLTTSALQSGTRSLTAKATDAAGNTSAASAVLSVVIASSGGTVAAPQIVSWTTDTGVVGDGITSNTTPTLSGTAVANSTVNVYDAGTLLGSATASSAGAWTYTTPKLGNGLHTFTAKDTVSGVNSAASSAVSMTIDNTAPTAPVESSVSVNGSTVLVVGTAEGSSTVKVYDGSSLVGTGTAAANGSWSVTTSALSGGAHSLAATATDAAGNVSVNSGALPATIAASTPSSTVRLTSLWAWGGQALVKGLADPSSTVNIYDGSTLVGSGTADTTGHWRVQTGTIDRSTPQYLTAKEVSSSGAVVAVGSGAAIVGTANSDVLTSTSGNDVFFGAGSLDTFKFSAGFGHDLIMDGGDGDTFYLPKTEFANFSAVLSHANQVGANTVIYSGNDILTIANTTLSTLTASQFHFT